MGVRSSGLSGVEPGTQPTDGGMTRCKSMLLVYMYISVLFIIAWLSPVQGHAHSVRAADLVLISVATSIPHDVLGLLPLTLYLNWKFPDLRLHQLELTLDVSLSSRRSHDQAVSLPPIINRHAIQSFQHVDHDERPAPSDMG
jgi:hypothetical protein